MSDREPEIVLNGKALRALVRAAETPLVGIGVKKQMLGQLGLNRLLSMDLRDYMDPAPALRFEIVEPRQEVDNE